MFIPSSFYKKNQSSKSASGKSTSMGKSMSGARKSNLLAMQGMKAKKAMPKATARTTAKKMSLLNPLNGAMGKSGPFGRMEAKGTTMKKNMLGAAKKMGGRRKSMF